MTVRDKSLEHAGCWHSPGPTVPPVSHSCDWSRYWGSSHRTRTPPWQAWSPHEASPSPVGVRGGAEWEVLKTELWLWNILHDFKEGGTLLFIICQSYVLGGHKITHYKYKHNMKYILHIKYLLISSYYVQELKIIIPIKKEIINYKSGTPAD